MTFVEMISLSIIQGIGEFLPISSSGHIVIFKKIFLKNNNLDFLTNGGLEVFLHIATLFSVLVYFRTEIMNIVKGIISGKDYTQARNIVIASIPTGIIGIIIKKSELDIFNSLTLVLANLFLTGAVLIISSRVKNKELKEISGMKSFFIGLLQGIAILPGISRSGLTISGSMFMNIDRKKAASFSFIILLPALCGAIVLEAKELSTINFDMMICASFFLTFLFGIAALKLLFGLIEKDRFKYFGYYCCTLSLVGFIYMFIGGAA